MFTDTTYLPNEKKMLSYHSTPYFFHDRNGARIDDRGDYILNWLLEAADLFWYSLFCFHTSHVGSPSRGVSLIVKRIRVWLVLGVISW